MPTNDLKSVLSRGCFLARVYGRVCGRKEGHQTKMKNPPCQTKQVADLQGSATPFIISQTRATFSAEGPQSQIFSFKGPHSMLPRLFQNYIFT